MFPQHSMLEFHTFFAQLFLLMRPRSPIKSSEKSLRQQSIHCHGQIRMLHFKGHSWSNYSSPTSRSDGVFLIVSTVFDLRYDSSSISLFREVIFPVFGNMRRFVETIFSLFLLVSCVVFFLFSASSETLGVKFWRSLLET